MPTGETIRKINVGGTEHDVVGSAEALWGSIQGSLGSQTDLVEALAEKQNVLTFDNTPTAGSNNPVKSGGIKTALDAKYDKALANVLGAKNLFPFTLSRVRGLANGGTWTNNVWSIGSLSLTFTTDDSGAITEIDVNGSYTSNVFFILYPNTAKNIFEGKIINGCPSGGSTSTSYSLIYRIGKQNEDTYVGEGADVGEGAIIPSLDPSTEHFRVYIRIQANYSCSHLKFRPMIRLASDTDDAFEPFAKSNHDLTADKCDNSVIAPVESGAIASRAYAVGEHFIRDGAFCTAKTAIASGATFTLNTNYTTGDINNELITQSNTFTHEKIYHSSGTVGTGYAFKSGKLAQIVINGFQGLTNQTYNYLNGVIPEGYRPARNTIKTVFVYRSTGVEFYQVSYNTSGNIHVYPYNGVSGASNLQLSDIYLIP